MLKILNTPEEAIDDLAIALGMWVGSGQICDTQVECFVESVLVLAYKAGVLKQRALRPFDVTRNIAEKVWAQCENVDTIKNAQAKC